MAALQGNGKMRATPLGMVAIPVRITFGTSGAPTLGNDYAAVTSVVRDATGRYSVTFADLWRDILGMAQMHDYQGTATDGQWQVFTGYVNTTGVIVLSHTVAGSEADPASADQVDLIFFGRNTDVGVT